MKQRNQRTRHHFARSRNSIGFSLMEILVALAIGTVLTALLIANVNGFQRKARIAHIVETVTTLAAAIREFERQVGYYPSELIVLYRAPTTADKDICNVNLPQSAVNKWRGPYVGREILTTGIVIETDTIQNDVDREPLTPASPQQVGNLQIYVRNAPIDIANDIDLHLDGDGILTEGPVQWTPSPGYPRIIYNMRISGC